MSVDPPGPPVRALPGLLKKLAVDRLGLMKDAADLGDAVRVSMGPKKLYIFNRPDYAKHVLADNSANYHKGIGLVQARRVLGDGLLTSDGEVWRNQRRTVQPAFKPGRINQQADAVAEEAAKLVALLRTHEGGGPVDVLREVTGLTLGVLGRTLLDSDLTAHESVAHAFEEVQDQAMLEMVTQGMVPAWLPFPAQRRFRRARRELYRAVDLLVADRSARMADGEPADDALSRIDHRGGPQTGARPCRGPQAAARGTGHAAARRARDHGQHPRLDAPPGGASPRGARRRPCGGPRRPRGPYP